MYDGGIAQREVTYLNGVSMCPWISVVYREYHFCTGYIQIKHKSSLMQISVVLLLWFCLHNFEKIEVKNKWMNSAIVETRWMFHDLCKFSYGQMRDSDMCQRLSGMLLRGTEWTVTETCSLIPGTRGSSTTCWFTNLWLEVVVPVV